MISLKPKKALVMQGVKPKIIAAKKALSSVPKAPSWLSNEAKAEWKRVAPILIDRKTLTDADLGTLESYVTAIGTVRAGQKLINAEGLVIQSPQGAKKHPAVGIVNAAQTTARLTANELGLTPVSRSRPAMREDKSGDELAFLD